MSLQFYPGVFRVFDEGDYGGDEREAQPEDIDTMMNLEEKISEVAHESIENGASPEELCIIVEQITRFRANIDIDVVINGIEEE